MSWANVPHPLGAHFGRPRPPKRGPRASQKQPKWSQKREKMDVEKQVVFRLYFFMVWRSFSMVFWMIFGSQKLPKLLKHIFAKTWKIVIFPRENWYFQGFEGLKLKWTTIKKKQKLTCFLDIDLGSLWSEFLRRFGRPKTSILAVFSNKNRRQKSMMSWKAPKNHQEDEKSCHRRGWRNGRETKETKFQAKLPAGGVGEV